MTSFIDREARERQTLDGATDYAIISMDLDGHVTRWNEGARRILGWDETEMRGATLHRIFTDRFETRDARGFVEWRLFPVDSPVFDLDAAPDQTLLALGTRNGTWLVADYSSAG